MRQFLKTSLAFTAGLLVVLAAADRFLGWRMARLHGKTNLSPEIYRAIERANEQSSSIHSIFLGDSVSHELFWPGFEGRPDERFLTSNQAGSLAAQYYILADAVRSFPNLRAVYLFYYPGSFGNDLGPPLSNDYFCGFFHSPAEIREVFGVKRELRLSLAQIGRLILPNILATNSLNRPLVWEMDWSRPSGAATGGGTDPEPLLALLDRIVGALPDDPPPPSTDVEQPVFLSHVSRHYLPKMHELCRAHGIALHVLPCPCSDARAFVDTGHVYERPILYRPAAQFGDGVHVKERFRGEAVRQLEAAYDLPPRSESVPVTAHPPGSSQTAPY
jgi:hypothetical protein